MEENDLLEILKIQQEAMLQVVKNQATTEFILKKLIERIEKLEKQQAKDSKALDNLFKERI